VWLAFLPLGAAALMIGCALVWWWQGRTAESWPVVPGRITESSRMSSTDADGTSYAAYIEYEYEVNGRRWTSRAVCPGGPVFTSVVSWVDKAIARYPVGMAVAVRHHPEHPERALLETWPRMFWVMFGSGVAFALSGVAMLMS